MDCQQVYAGKDRPPMSIHPHGPARTDTTFCDIASTRATSRAHHGSSLTTTPQHTLSKRKKRKKSAPPGQQHQRTRGNSRMTRLPHFASVLVLRTIPLYQRDCTAISAFPFALSLTQASRLTQASCSTTSRPLKKILTWLNDVQCW